MVEFRGEIHGRSYHSGFQEGEAARVFFVILRLASDCLPAMSTEQYEAVNKIKEIAESAYDKATQEKKDTAFVDGGYRQPLSEEPKQISPSYELLGVECREFKPIHEPKQISPTKRVSIMRKAVLMEDEGRDSFVKYCLNRDEALAWIARQENEYFKPNDYYIAGGST